MSKRRIIFDLSASERALILECARALGATDLLVAQLGRVGYSGASLYKAHSPGGRPVVIKVDRKASIRLEDRAIKKINRYFDHPLLPLSPPQPFYKDRVGALVYKHIGATPTALNRIVELKELLYDFKTIDDGRICEIFRRSYERLRVGDDAIRREKILLSQDFGRYQRLYRNRSVSAHVVANVLGTEDGRSRPVLLGTSIVHPTKFVKWLIQQRWEVARGPIHGDLHPNNIVLDADDAPRIIDFEWARGRAHRLIDCVLMECSVRFHHFPRHFNIRQQLIIDKLLLHWDGFSDIHRVTRHWRLKDHYRRMAKIVECIRTHGAIIGGGLSPDRCEEYFVAQALVLHGLLQYNGYDNASVVRALGLLAKHLES